MVVRDDALADQGLSAFRDLDTRTIFVPCARRVAHRDREAIEVAQETHATGRLEYAYVRNRDGHDVIRIQVSAGVDVAAEDRHVLSRISLRFEGLCSRKPTQNSGACDQSEGIRSLCTRFVRTLHAPDLIRRLCSAECSLETCGIPPRRTGPGSIRLYEQGHRVHRCRQ